MGGHIALWCSTSPSPRSTRKTRADLEDLMLRLWSELDLTVIFVTHDIDEAVYLGHRVLVLSSSATRILDDVLVDIETRRGQATTRIEPRFAELRTRIYRGVQEAKSAASATKEPIKG
jgi:NitT/TauT family transport system ATP-binding protein